MKRALVVLCVVLMPSCGSSGGGPAAPNPTPAANDITASGTVAGSTITVTECGGGCTRGVRVDLQVTYTPATDGAVVYLQLFDAASRQCGFAFSNNGNVPAGRPTAFVVDFLNLQCSLPFTSTSLRATLFGPGQQPVEQRTGLVAKVFNAGWTFKAPGSGSGPDPSPSPNPTPKPTPTPGPAPTPKPPYPACPGTHSGPGCSRASGQCNDGTYTCSQNRSGTCSTHNGLKCVYCPGPICQGIFGDEGEPDASGIDWSAVGLR